MSSVNASTPPPGAEEPPRLIALAEQFQLVVSIQFSLHFHSRFFGVIFP